MFDKKTITNKLTFDFWKSLSSINTEKQIGDHFYKFEKIKDATLILIKNEDAFLNPKTDFIQAKIQKNQISEESITVEAKKFISILYQGLIVFISVFAALTFSNNIAALLLIAIVLTLIMRYNYKKINEAIHEFAYLIENGKP